MTFEEWYEAIVSDCPAWRTWLAMESARVVWTAATTAERERSGFTHDALYSGEKVADLRAALTLACETLAAFMNLPIEFDAAWIEQEKEDLAVMDRVRAALGLRPWLESRAFHSSALGNTLQPVCILVKEHTG